MESDRSHMSITLPRNFQFHYRDGHMPQTPEPEPQPEELQPPPPPRQTLKVRRRRTTMVQHDDVDFPMDQRPIPTIEAPELHSEFSSDLPLPVPMQDDAYLSPGVTYTRMLSPPKTPVAQMRTIASFDGPQHWSDIDQSSQSESSSRPTSSSGFSDSSFSSRGSIESFMSRDGSCTSPEDEVTDPMLAFSPEVKYGQPTTSPLPAFQSARPAKSFKMRATFTEDMDCHLWMTYMNYLQDPTVTPFKALPGTTPPNGVCHRVARMARKTWKGPRLTRAGVRAGAQFRSRSGTEDTIRPLKSGSNTPVARASKSLLRYPTEKQCRKRLRDLAKQKPTLSAHYQRLLLLATKRDLRSPKYSSGTTAVIALLEGNHHILNARHERVPRDKHCHINANGQPTFEVGHWNPASGTEDMVERSSMRGSSFKAMSEMTDVSMHQSNAQTWHPNSSSAQPPRLGSPFQLHTPRPISRVFKRRALNSSFEDRARNRGNSFVDELFGAPAESSHRRVRSRGFSLGDMAEGARRLPIATNALENNPFVNAGTSVPSSSKYSPAQMQGQATIRLGSPFGSRPSNTFPRATTPLSFEPPVSFEQRLAAMPSDQAFFQRS
ncbi:hypothetical protein SNOG_02619 [Parastagonospora nodorum SN15]|uniref:Uncharacterized protein n=1 Tax=Phaeosphaeria nodorum (strain SN15 / ATCC MYA-4574 / FGSC 10173) TaxID=321614 RepID=Q0V045_PHANO|nr:hypothetical protein SNOG_02619 [Parastagonospora nodorum SN15]EAT89350.2 hypothetical protein SNOG_02619 [Parastagonospora nodorum SN15]